MSAERFFIDYETFKQEVDDRFLDYEKETEDAFVRVKNDIESAYDRIRKLEFAQTPSQEDPNPPPFIPAIKPRVASIEIRYTDNGRTTIPLDGFDNSTVGGEYRHRDVRALIHALGKTNDWKG